VGGAMAPQLTVSRLANVAAHSIHDAFDRYHARFRALTRRAGEHFEARSWEQLQADATERIDVYAATVHAVVTNVRELLGERVEDRLVWASMKAVYSGLIEERRDWELAETFFNSITRRIFTTVGVDDHIEFVNTDFTTPPAAAQGDVFHSITGHADAATVVAHLLRLPGFTTPYRDADDDARRAGAVITEHLEAVGLPGAVGHVDVLKPVFYRGRRSFIVGRMVQDEQQVPLVLVLVNTDDGIVVDAVLQHATDVSILFSYTRSYFMVDAPSPYDLVRFLKSTMPRKRLAELYISIGYNKHGKTELYRDLLAHLATSDAKFEIAPGALGMVMVVFTLADYDLVFKVIKDQFAYPKSSTRRQVMDKYRLVFHHDRAGRLIDAQEFEHLVFARERFAPALLEELQNLAPDCIDVDDAHVVVKHAYVERRVIPLNLYLQQAAPAEALAAVIDYGNACKDLAASNIFPGDMMLKNYGVTRHRRVVFYDYDELCLLTDCRFRSIPEPRTYAEEMSAEPWFAVDVHDVFPEEFGRFIGLTGDQRATFMAHHADLLDVDFWQRTKERLQAGERIDIVPYDASRCLHERCE
jgi:isocitrate dehydrogenase kinase/phosphatase